MENENNKTVFSINARQWIPIAGLVILTIALIIYFKNKNINEIVDEQRNNLVDFYTQNLKPLFVRTPITTEDVYNFALSNELPLDKNNKQYLKLGDGTAGNNYFEFVKVSNVETKEDLNYFKSSLGLGEYEKQKVDSILESYTDELRNQVLVNENNTIAINSNIWNLNKAIRTDLLMFASQANREKFKKLYPKYYSFYRDPSLYKFVEGAREAGDSNFIFVTPDSIFSSVYKVNQEKLNQEMKNLDENMKEWEKDYKIRIAFQKEIDKQQKKAMNQKFTITLDSNFCRIQIPSVAIPPIKIPNIDHYMAGLEDIAKITKDLKIKIKTKEDKVNKSTNVDYSDVDIPEHPDEYELNIELPDLKELIETSVSAGLGAVKGLNIPNVNVDSIMQMVQMELNDSLNHFDEKAFKKQMEELKKELKKQKSLRK